MAQRRSSAVGHTNHTTDRPHVGQDLIGSLVCCAVFARLTHETDTTVNVGRIGHRAEGYRQR